MKLLDIIAGPVIVEPEVAEEISTGSGRGGWIVTVFNNDFNTWEEVMTILQMATGCGPDEAYIETWEIDSLGASVVHNAGKAECSEAAGVIGTIGIKVTVSED
ncbi:MAG: ATP-dependent Clp protease adaptor ClpS [Fimbriimonadales bacterium]